MQQPTLQRSLQVNPLVDGPLKTALAPAAYTTSGSGAALIQPPKRTSRTVRIEINSADRDLSQSPSSTHFRWVFPFPVKEVRELRLVGGTIPVPYLNIDTQWNKCTFMDNQTNYTLTIPVGFYTITTLASALQTALNSLGGFNIYTVSISPTTGQLVISAVNGAEYGFLFATGDFCDVIDAKTHSLLEIRSLAKFLGFGHADYTTFDPSLYAPRLPNLWYPVERAYLYLNFDTSIDLRSVRRGAGRQEPTAILYYDELTVYNLPDTSFSSQPFPLTKYLNRETYDSVVEPAPASLSRISYIEISLRDMFFNLINAQGREMTLLLDLVIVD